MLKKEIEEYLIDYQKMKLPDLVSRELKIDKTQKIKSIIGPRRAGKTFFLFQNIEGLIGHGIKKENTLYLNFEEPRLIEVNFKEIRDIIKLHWQLYQPNKELSLFIDEPQNIENWEIAVRALYDEGFNIFLTGSSSKLLSKEISTSLRGRTLTYTLLPFSFREFLKMKNADFDITRLSSKEKSSLMYLLNEYLVYGGFPELITEKNAETKIRILREYFDLIVYKDIVDRYKIKNTQLIKWLIKSLTASYSKEFSIHKLYLILKSKGLKLSKNTLYAYVSMLEDSMFVFFLSRFKRSIRKGDFSINKAYLCDTSFSKLVEATEDKGRKMENLVFLELKRKQQPLQEIYYWSDGNYEVDFVVKDKGKIKQLIQACYNLDEYDTKKREINALVNASRELKCNNLLVITEDVEKEETTGSKLIKYVPLWKFLYEPAKRSR